MWLTAGHEQCEARCFVIPVLPCLLWVPARLWGLRARRRLWVPQDRPPLFLLEVLTRPARLWVPQNRASLVLPEVLARPARLWGLLARRRLWAPQGRSSLFLPEVPADPARLWDPATPRCLRGPARHEVPAVPDLLSALENRMVRFLREDPAALAGHARPSGLEGRLRRAASRPARSGRLVPGCRSADFGQRCWCRATRWPAPT